MSTVRAAIDALYRAMLAHDIPALDALLDADFELREAAQPGRPLPRHTRPRTARP